MTRIAGTAGLYDRMGDGYDTMDTARRDGWRAISGWGRDGWDLGDWPYVVVYWRTPAAGVFQVATVVEGDVDAHEFATELERERHTDSIALFYWQVRGEPWVQRREGREPYTVDTMPHKLRGPYRAR